MANRRKRHYRPAQSHALVTTVQDKRSESRRALDGYINSLAYLGEASDLMQSNDYTRHSISRDWELLTVMYRENWIAKRIIDTPCEDMTRSWYTVSSEIEQDKLDELAKLEAKHNIKQEITNALRWARLYGGAAAVIVLKGQEDLLDQPLDYDTLMPGCFRGLIVLDRMNGLYPSLELEEDMDDPEFGYPMYYNVILDQVGGETLKIHHSRLIVFRGRMLPIQEEINEEYWGASEIEHVYEELQKRNATSANIAQLVFQANVSAMKIGDFGEALAMGTDIQREKIMRSIFDMNRIKNNFGLLLMGNEDNYEQHPYSFAGIAEVYESFMLDMAGAAEIPATKLYGRAPQGMNATGESDMKNYYEMLAQLQERNLRPAIEKLLPIMAMSLWGVIPEDMEVVFEPLMTTTPAERAEINAKETGTVIQAFSAGLISQKTALLALQKMGKDIGEWTIITDEDIDKAEDEIDTGEGEQDPMGMMGPGGPEGGPGGGGMPPEGMMPPEGAPAGEMPPEAAAMAPEAAAPEEPAPEEPEPKTEQDERADKIHDLRERIQRIREKAESEEKEETEDGGPGSGPRPGYHKNGSSLVQRAAFIANPTAGMAPVRQPQRTNARVAKANRERNEWSNLTLHQKIQGNAQQERHMRKMKAQVAKMAAKGDIEGAKRIVQQNRHYWSNDPASAQKVQSETLKRQKAEKKGFIRDTLLRIRALFAGDGDIWRTSEEGKHFKFNKETGEIKAGFGGKHNGKKIGESWGNTGTEKYFRVKGPERVAPEKSKGKKVPMTFTKYRDGTAKRTDTQKKEAASYEKAKKETEEIFARKNAPQEDLDNAVYRLSREAGNADGANSMQINYEGEFGINGIPREWSERLAPEEQEVLSKLVSEYSSQDWRTMEKWEKDNPESTRTIATLQAKLLGAEVDSEIPKGILEKYGIAKEERVEVPGQQSMFLGENVEPETTMREPQKNGYQYESRSQNYGSNTGKNDFSKGFTKKKLKEHASKHAASFGCRTAVEYNKRAKEFGSQPVGGNIAGGRDRNGQIVRYDKETCTLFVGNPRTKTPLTFFIIKNGDKEKAKEYMKRHFPDIEI